MWISCIALYKWICSIPLQELSVVVLASSSVFFNICLHLINAGICNAYTHKLIEYFKECFLVLNVKTSQVYSHIHHVFLGLCFKICSVGPSCLDGTLCTCHFPRLPGRLPVHLFHCCLLSSCLSAVWFLITLNLIWTCWWLGMWPCSVLAYMRLRSVFSSQHNLTWSVLL